MIGESQWVEDFNVWLGQLPHAWKVVVSGNHDRSMDLVANGASLKEARLHGRKVLSNATHYLLDEPCEIMGLRMWGSPYTPFFHSDYWKFHYDPATVGRWDQIPPKLDVLITHGPPRYHLDLTMEGERAGCWDLHRRIRDMHLTDDQPRVHCFGHIHEARGSDTDGQESGRTRMYNVSAVDRLYRLRPEPCTIIDLEPG